MANEQEHFIGYLCRAWGESDMPCAEFARDLEGVSRFMVREWLGEEDATDYDGAPTIPRLMAEWQDHDWKEDTLWSAEFEIGGVSVERMVCHLPTPPAAPPAAPGEVTVPKGWRIVATDEGILVSAPLGGPGGLIVSPTDKGLAARVLHGLCFALSHPAPVAAPAPLVPRDIRQAAIHTRDTLGVFGHPNDRAGLDLDHVQALAEFVHKLADAAPAPASEAVAEIVTFGGLDGQKEVAWRKGKMPPVGTKLYATPTPGDSADAPVQQAGERVPAMPETTGRRPHDDNYPEGYLESDESWSMNNPDAVSWLADNHEAIRAALKCEQPVVSHPATNVSHNHASGSSVSDKQPVEPSGTERGEV